jgi:hypothetical protein
MSKELEYFQENDIEEYLSDHDIDDFIEVKSLKKIKKTNNDSNDININIKKETKESPYITNIIKIGYDLFIEDYKNKNIIIFCFTCNDNKKITNLKVMKTIYHYKLGGIIYDVAGDCSRCGSKIYKNFNFERDNMKNKIKNIDQEIYNNIYNNINENNENINENS